MTSPIISEIVENDMCIGCGLCAAICPQRHLSMVWNQYGEYNPFEEESCQIDCGLCSSVCPFAENDDNEDSIGNRLYGINPGIKHRTDVGYFLSTFVGYSDNHRQSGASGGMVTWLLETALKEDIADYIICVAQTGIYNKLFEFKVFSSLEEISPGVGSVYYPVELSKVIKRILDVPGRYVITGLPCFIKAIRLAQRSNIKLRERIVLTIGLSCGQLKSKHFTDYASQLAGKKSKLTKVNYRGKNPKQPASNYYLSFITENGEESRINWLDGINQAWKDRWFTLNPCNFCDDIFAECADVTCMDAWLPEYSKNSEGTSLVLVRTNLIHDLIQRGDKIHLDPILIDRVVKSQAGILEIKRQQLSYRLYIDQHRGRKIPRKRVMLQKPRSYLIWNEVQRKERERLSIRYTWQEDPDAVILKARMRQGPNIMRKMSCLTISIIRKIRGQT